MPSNPLISQGTLNRIRTSVIVPSFSNLNVTAPYMGKEMARLAFEGNFSDLIGTATGAVESDEPYVFATLTINLLRTQSLSNAWLTQVSSGSGIGNVTSYSDSTAFDPVTLNNCVVRSVDPGAYNGSDPVVRITVYGTYIINNNLWNI